MGLRIDAQAEGFDTENTEAEGGKALGDLCATSLRLCEFVSPAWATSDLTLVCASAT